SLAFFSSAFASFCLSTCCSSAAIRCCKSLVVCSYCCLSCTSSCCRSLDCEDCCCAAEFSIKAITTIHASRFGLEEHRMRKVLVRRRARLCSRSYLQLQSLCRLSDSVR